MQSSHGRLTGVVLAGLLVCSLGAMVAVADGQSATAREPAVATGFADVESEAFDADRTRFRITTFENGSAAWVFQYEQRLDGDDSIDEFEGFAERFTDDETDSYRNFRRRAVSLADAGSEVTGREMAASDFQREARIEERPPAGTEFGVVEMSFVWTGFAERDGDRVIVGDVFVDGLYVGPDQELRFERGPGLRFDSVSPSEPDRIAGESLAESETITWMGDQQFTDRHPRVVYAPRNDDADPSPTDPGSGGSGSSEPPPSDGTPTDGGSVLPAALIAFVVLLGVGAAIAYRSGWRSDPGRSGEPSSTDVATPSSGSPVSPTPTDSHTPAEPADTDGGHGPSVPVVDRQPDVSEEDVLSDDARVVALLEDRGGRMRQVDIVGNTEWSKSKVSMLLSEMESEGTISKLRVGRENIVSLAGHEPDAAGSPFEDDG